MKPRIRLLPIVIVATSGLLVLKATALITSGEGLFSETTPPKQIRTEEDLPRFARVLARMRFIPPPADPEITGSVPAKKEPSKKDAAKETEKSAPKISTIAKKKPIAITTPTIKSNILPAADLANRKVEIIQSVYFKSDSLEITLYDNGEVDGDTVSVIMNGTVFMPKVGLSTNAVKKTIYTNEIAGDSIQLVMYAESLGSLPPNTGLLIVYDGNDRYEIRFSGDMQKSSAIVFRRRKE